MSRSIIARLGLCSDVTDIIWTYVSFDRWRKTTDELLSEYRNIWYWYNEGNYLINMKACVEANWRPLEGRIKFYNIYSISKISDETGIMSDNYVHQKLYPTSEISMHQH